MTVMKMSTYEVQITFCFSAPVVIATLQRRKQVPGNLQTETFLVVGKSSFDVCALGLKHSDHMPERIESCRPWVEANVPLPQLDDQFEVSFTLDAEERVDAFLIRLAVTTREETLNMEVKRQTAKKLPWIQANEKHIPAYNVLKLNKVPYVPHLRPPCTDDFVPRFHNFSSCFLAHVSRPDEERGPGMHVAGMQVDGVSCAWLVRRGHLLAFFFLAFYVRLYTGGGPGRPSNLVLIEV